jgi:hypothetical protein
VTRPTSRLCGAGQTGIRVGLDDDPLTCDARQTPPDTRDVGASFRVLEAAHAGRRMPLKGTVYDARR